MKKERDMRAVKMLVDAILSFRPLKGVFCFESCPRNPLVCLCSEYSLRG